ncbi:MAG TPA: M48 family metalloprotease [Pseudomonadales bacterium]
MSAIRELLRGRKDVRAAALPLLSGWLLLAGCAGTSYQPPAPSREAVEDVRTRVAATVPERAPLGIEAATVIATPIFRKIAEDAAMVCRTVAEADSCSVPGFQVLDLDLVNARAGYDLQNRPQVSVSRGLVEYLADQPDELALVIGHEYGHLIAAHVGEREPPASNGDGAVSAALAALAAASVAVATDSRVRISAGRSGHAPSRAEIDQYLRDTADPDGSYDWFSRAEELEADYLGTYLAVRSGYAPTGAALMELGALGRQDSLTALEKEARQVSYAYWDTHPWSADRAARLRATLAEIELVLSKGYARPLPPRLILELQDDNGAFHSLEELAAPLP